MITLSRTIAPLEIWSGHVPVTDDLDCTVMRDLGVTFNIAFAAMVLAIIIQPRCAPMRTYVAWFLCDLLTGVCLIRADLIWASGYVCSCARDISSPRSAHDIVCSE